MNNTEKPSSFRSTSMLEGELVEVNDAQQIYHQPQHDYTRRLWASMPRLHGEQIRQEVSQ